MLSLKWENSQSTVAWQRASACEISNKHIDISCHALTGPLLLWQTHESPVKHFMEFMKWKGVVSLPTETKMIKVMQFNTAYSVYVRVWFFSVWKPKVTRCNDSLVKTRWCVSVLSTSSMNQTRQDIHGVWLDWDTTYLLRESWVSLWLCVFTLWC